MSLTDNEVLFEKIDIGVREGIAKAIAVNKKRVREIDDGYYVYQVQLFPTNAVVQEGSIKKFYTYAAAESYIARKKEEGLPYPWVLFKRRVDGSCQFLNFQKGTHKDA